MSDFSGVFACELTDPARADDKSRPVIFKTLHTQPVPTVAATLFSAAIVIALTGVPKVFAQQSRAEIDRQKTEQRLEQQRRALEQARRKQSEVDRDVKLLDQERTRLTERLIETAKQIRTGETTLDDIESELKELGVKERFVRGSLEQRHASIAKLLSAMQRMGRNPPPVMATERGDALQMVRSAMMLASVFPELKDQALDLADRLNELEKITTTSKRKADEQRTQNRQLADARVKLDTLMREKKNTLLRRRQELAEIQRDAERFARSVASLEELMRKLDKTVTEKSGLGKYNQQLAEGTAPGQTKPASEASEVPTRPAYELSPRKKVAMVSPGRLKPAIPFAEARGALQLPVSGRRIRSFGEKTTFGTSSKGIAISTRSRAQVTSPCDGWVVFAGRFRRYGQLLIINAGGGYHVLLAGMDRIDATLGQFILEGEPIGQMGAQRRGRGDKSPGPKSVLYVEFRRKETPINPDPWWVEPKKVQG